VESGEGIESLYLIEAETRRPVIGVESGEGIESDKPHTRSARARKVESGEGIESPNPVSASAQNRLVCGIR